jgi:hypothetical protein
MASKDLKMNKHSTAGKRKHITSRIPEKLEVIGRLECGRRQREVMASYNIGSSTIYDTKKCQDQL